MTAGMSPVHLTAEPTSSLTPTPDRLMRDLQSRGATATASFDKHAMSFAEFTSDDDTYDVQEEFPLFGETSASQSTLPNTISPQDLALTHDDFSHDLINSQSFDSLNTPSLYDDTSPFLDSIDTSPAFENFRPEHGFAPLFPQDEQTPEPPRKRKHGEPDVASSTDSFIKPNAPAISRNTSSRSLHTYNATDRELMRQRLSMAGEIPKSTRRASRTLGPIEVESGDENAAKRAKNTLAARKSRQKKKDEVAQLETKLLEMMTDRDHWKMMAISHGAPVPNSPSPSAMSPN